MHLDATDLALVDYRGGLALVGRALDAAFNTFTPDTPRPSRPLHLTLLTAAERRALRPPLNTFPPIPLDDIYVLGIGEKRGVRWLVVVWNHADVFRSSIGLGRKDYHLTLTDTDDHGADKSMGTLARAPDELVAYIASMGEKALDHAFVACQDPTMKREIAGRMLDDYPDSYKGFARYAGVVRPKASLLAYARAAALNPSLIPMAAAHIRKLRDDASYGPVANAPELDDLHPALLLGEWPSDLDDAVRVLWTHPTTSRERQIHSTYELPRFFSWIYPGRLAGMSTPRNAADIDALASMGITHVLTLTAETPLPVAWVRWKVKHLFVPVPNYGAPTLAEMDAIFARITQGGTWLVHCGGGVGRAGTVHACLIAMLGRDGDGSGDGEEPALDARTAISVLRHARPRSLETEEQERFVVSWVSHRWKRRPTAVTEPVTLLDVLGDTASPRALMLVGRPGSGKSFVAHALLKRRPAGKTLLISQDDSGSRAQCETAASRCGNLPDDTLVILDRCNPEPADRKKWLALLGRPCVAVFFDYPVALCEQRINARLGHPTLRAGRGANALAQMDGLMTAPTLSEGFVGIISISSIPAAANAVRLLAPPVPLLKFPRTPHLLNLGAAGDDDIVPGDNEWFSTLRGNLTLEEKIDGANMGLSLDSTGATVCVQNRSHWVSSADHAQFRPLDRWLAVHGDTLRSLLLQDAHFPERYILYGEWVVARHSITYDSLPGHFVAFDLYDRVERSFLSRSALEDGLDRTQPRIPLVPLLRRCESLSREEILALLQQTSSFGDQRIEGVYVRFEDEGRTRTVDRGKIVRGDFIAGNEHWARGPLVLNGLRSEWG